MAVKDVVTGVVVVAAAAVAGVKAVVINKALDMDKMVLVMSCTLAFPPGRENAERAVPRFGKPLFEDSRFGNWLAFATSEKPL